MLWTDTMFEAEDGIAGLRAEQFSAALSCWAWMQMRPVTVNEAAATFNVAPNIVTAAVENHPWMYLAGDMIEHDGE